MPRSPEVDAWFARYQHPEKTAMIYVRDTLLRADPRLTECVKWQTPTFVFEGNLCSIVPNAKRFISLLFHHGALIPGRHKRLQGGGGTARYLRIDNLEDARAAKADLEAIVTAWCDMRTGKLKPKKAAKKAPAQAAAASSTTTPASAAKTAKKAAKKATTKAAKKATKKKTAKKATKKATKKKTAKKVAKKPAKNATGKAAKKTAKKATKKTAKKAAKKATRKVAKKPARRR